MVCLYGKHWCCKRDICPLLQDDRFLALLRIQFPQDRHEKPLRQFLTTFFSACTFEGRSISSVMNITQDIRSIVFSQLRL